MTDTSSHSEKQARYRARLRAKGLRPIQIWVPDTRAPGFAAECRRQCKVMNESDRRDPDLNNFLMAAASWIPDEEK
jgi:hypothetical protein